MLPKIEQPTFSLILPSNKKKISYRAFSVKEEKILLMAQHNNEQEEMLRVVQHMVQNCVVTPNFDAAKLTLFDLEYLFVNLRSKSVNNILTLTMVDPDDNRPYNFEIDLDLLKVEMNKDVKNKLEVTDSIMIQLRYPTIGSIEQVRKYVDAQPESEKSTALALAMVAAGIEKIFDDDKVYVAEENFQLVEAIEFVESLPLKSLTGIQEFMNTIPQIEHNVTYKNSFGNERTITLKGLSDFFTL